MEVGVDIKSFANIFNPYFLDKTNPHAPKTDADTLYHSIFKRYRVDMSSIDPSSREIQCKTIRDEFLAAGYKGIYTKYDGFETVVFDLAAVRSVRPVNGYYSQGKMEGTQI